MSLLCKSTSSYSLLPPLTSFSLVCFPPFFPFRYKPKEFSLKSTGMTMRLTKVFSGNFYPNHFVRLQRAAHSSVWYRAILLRFLFQLHFKVQWNLDLTNLYLTNDILCPGESYSKMYGIEPRCNEYNPEAQT